MTPLGSEQAMQMALGHHQAGRAGQAEAIYRQILAQQPNHARALHLLGVLAAQAGRFEAAVELIGRAIAINPGAVDYHLNLGECYRQMGQLDQTIACLQRAISAGPNRADAHNKLGLAWLDKRQPDQAIACLQKALLLQGNFPSAYNNLGNAWKDKGQLDQAAACYQRALALKGDFPEALNNLGNIWTEQGKLDQAIACFQQALKLMPNSSAAHNNLGNALSAKGQVDQAMDCFGLALQLDPECPQTHNNLGNAWKKKGQLDQAMACFQRATQIKPDYAEAFSNLGNAWKDMGQADEAIACYRQALQLNPGLIGAHDNLLYTMHYHSACDAPGIFAESRKWNHQHAEPLKQFIRPHKNERNPQRKLRIGYMGDLGDHPVGRFMLPLLSNHDRNAFAVHCYAQAGEPDEMTAKLRGLVAGWRNIVSASDEQAAEMIRQDRIDILVDLAMHAGNNRLLVFARKPAPVQVTYLAYASGTGLETIDYRLTDRYLDPDEGLDKYYAEKSIRLSGTYWCYQPDAATPPVDELPALRGGKITFGCLNNYCKVTPETQETWVKLLLRLGEARLLLYSPRGRHRERLLRFMQDKGIEPARLELVGHLPLVEYLQTYGRVDIALDPFPYGGGTTSCDALWMGVPVVTLSGRTAVGRAGVSILSNAGLPELIAHTPEEYVKIAADLAGDLPRLAELRRRLRQRMQSSPLMDAGQFTRSIESAYRQMWRQWCT